MKKHFMKYSLMLFSAFMMWCGVSENVNAEEAGAHCYPSEEQIQIFKEDGTWEERQAYVKNLNYSKPSQELLYNAIQREHGFSTYAAGDDIPYDRKGMQVTGDAKLLLVRVEFADVKFENSKNYTEQEFYNMVMGNTSTGTFPYESLNAYYKRSSYNKLNITSDKVYSCTLSKNREEYEGEFDGEQDLIKEVLTLLDENVDFNNYDANQDGQIDGICINFAGENTDWGSTWWSHKFNFLDNSIQFDNVTPAGYIFQETHNKNDSSGTQTLIHETGHLLGLPDYYGQWSDGIGATDMMKDNRGDHNGFSKWLLGWIEEKNILKITKADGDTKVELSPLASEVIGDQPLIAVIAPEDTSIYSEYFVVQYDEYMGNQSFYELEDPGYRVFHVDAQLNDDGTNFEHDNIYEYNNHYLIRAVPIIEDENGTLRYYYINGDQLTPDTNESSAFYGGNILGFTGIAMTDFVTGDSPSFNVSFREKEALDGKLELQIEDSSMLNMAEMTLISNKPLIDAWWSYETAYLEDSEGNKHYIEHYLEDGSQQITTSYVFIANQLKPETEYTLVFPSGMFQIDEDVYSEECRLNVKTGVFPKIEADFTYNSTRKSNIFNVDNTKSGIIQIVQSTSDEWIAEMSLFEETEEVKKVQVNLPIPEAFGSIRSINALTCYDGTIAIEIRKFQSLSSFYKIDLNGNVVAGPVVVEDKLDVFPAGNGLKGVSESAASVGAPDLENESKLEIYSIDFENEPSTSLVDMHKYRSRAYALDKESYVVIQDSDQGNQANIFNNNDELIQMMDISDYIEESICAAIKSGDHLAILHSTYLEYNDHLISISIFDMEGNHLGTHEIFHTTSWKDLDGWSFDKTSWGYSLYNRTSQQAYMIYFLNDDFELIFTMQVPDSIVSATHMGNRCAFTWYDYTIPGEAVAITEPIVVEDAPETDESTDEEETKETIAPETDESQEESKETETPESEETKETETLESEETKQTEAPESEATKQTDVPETNEPKNEDTTKETKPNDNPDTADRSNITMVCFAMLASGIIMLLCFGRYWLRDHR